MIKFKAKTCDFLVGALKLEEKACFVWSKSLKDTLFSKLKRGFVDSKREGYSDPYQTSKMEPSAQIDIGFSH